MALVIKDRVYETSTTTGTGTLTLAGAVTGFQTFSTAVGNGNTTYYVIQDQSGPQWEIGIGTVGAGTLARTTVLQSSNGGSLVNFTTGALFVFGDYPADKAVYGNGTVLVAPSGTILPVGNGGTGLSTLTANNVILGNGTSNPTFVAPGTSGNVLTSNGTTWTSAPGGGGGGSLLYYKESTTTPTTPVASGTYSIAMGNSSTAIESSSTGSGAVSINGYSSGIESFSAAINRNSSSQTNMGALGNESIAIGKYATAQNYRSVAIGYSSIASADGSVCIGIEGRTWGSESVALGRSVASGVSSFSAITSDASANYGSLDADTIAIGYHAIANYGQGLAIGYGATATGYRGLAIGYTAEAKGGDAIAIGDGAVVNSGYNHAIALGAFAVSSGNDNITIGYGSASAGQSAIAIGEQAYANINYGVSIGYYAQNDQTINKYTYGTKVCDSFGGGARAQAGKLILGVATTDNTPTALSSNTNAATYNNQLNFTTSYQAIAFTGLVVCRQDAASGSDSSAWKIEGLIRREAGGGTEVLVASSVTAISNVSGYTVALSADTTNGCLAVTVTGGATTNLHWIATIDTAEVSYE